MENVYEEMARTLEQTYKKARVHVGNREGRGKKVVYQMGHFGRFRR